jgi:hypothetical protein
MWNMKVMWFVQCDHYGASCHGATTKKEEWNYIAILLFLCQDYNLHVIFFNFTLAWHVYAWYCCYISGWHDYTHVCVHIWSDLCFEKTRHYWFCTIVHQGFFSSTPPPPHHLLYAKENNIMYWNYYFFKPPNLRFV